MNFINRYSNFSTNPNRRAKSTPKIADDRGACIDFRRDLQRQQLQQQNSQNIFQIAKRRTKQQNAEISNNKSIIQNRNNNWIFSDIFSSARKKECESAAIERRRSAAIILNDQLRTLVASQKMAESTTTATTAPNPYLEILKEECPKSDQLKSGYENFETENTPINDYVARKIWPVDEPMFENMRQDANHQVSLNSRELNALCNARLQMDELQKELEAAKSDNETLRQKFSGLEQQTLKLYAAKRNFNEKLKQVVIDYEKQIDKLKNDLDFESQANRKTFLECASLRKDLSEKDKEIASLTEKIGDDRKSAETKICKLQDDIRELENRCKAAESKCAQLENSINLAPDVDAELVNRIEQMEQEIAENDASKSKALKSCLTKDCRRPAVVKKKRLLFKY